MIKVIYEFVCDEIKRSWDVQDKRVTKSATEVLEQGVGICWAKANLLAAFLRACGIPAGICYQRLTLGDVPETGFCIHALNAVYIKIETCEEKPIPELFEREVLLLKEKGVFDAVNDVLVGKPQDEAFYQEYKDILIKVIDNEKLPIVYNVNFGHATPRCALRYGAVAKVDMKQKWIFVNK